MRANDRVERAWAKAAQLAEGVEDHGVGGGLRRYFTLYWPTASLVAFGAGFFVGHLLDDRSTRWTLALQVGFTMVLLVNLLAGYLYWWRKIRPLVQPQRMSITSWLDRPDEKGVTDQILGRMPVVEEQLPVLRGAAAQLRASGSLYLTLAPSYLFMVAAFAVRTQGPVLCALWSLVLLGNVGAIIYTTWTFRRAGRFLKATDPLRNRGEAAPPSA